MVEIVEDTTQEGSQNLIPGIAGAAGFGFGSLLLGPALGLPLGGTVAGAYVGGMAGTVLTVSGMALGLSTLLVGNPFTRRASSGGSSNAQGVK